jgi:membrane-bound inhibitor of C-type lysozyme
MQTSRIAKPPVAIIRDRNVIELPDVKTGAGDRYQTGIVRVFDNGRAV